MTQHLNSLTVNNLISQMQNLIDLGITYGLKLILAVVILIVGLWIERKINKSLKKILQAKDIEPSLVSFLSSFMNIALKIVVIIIVLTTVGIAMTSIIAVLGAASLAIGMALSGTLQNIAGGVVILFLKPFRIGDLIETQGKIGTVENIYIFTTKIRTPDNKTIYLPNASLSNTLIVNINERQLRRLDCTFGISYGENVEIAREILLNILTSDQRVLKDPLPMIYLSQLADSSVNILARFWVAPSDVTPVQFELNEKVYTQFTEHGLSFPFPQMDVHVSNN